MWQAQFTEQAEVLSGTCLSGKMKGGMGGGSYFMNICGAREKANINHSA